MSNHDLALEDDTSVDVYLINRDGKPVAIRSTLDSARFFVENYAAVGANRWEYQESARRWVHFVNNVAWATVVRWPVHP